MTPKRQRKHEPADSEDIVAGVLAVLVLGNGALSAATATWLPTVAALGLIVFAGWYVNR